MVGIKKARLKPKNSNSITDEINLFSEDANKDIDPNEIKMKIERFKSTQSIKIKATGLSIESLADAAGPNMIVIGGNTFRPIFLLEANTVEKAETSLNDIMDKIGKFAETQHDKIQKKYNDDLNDLINTYKSSGYELISLEDW